MNEQNSMPTGCMILILILFIGGLIFWAASGSSLAIGILVLLIVLVIWVVIDIRKTLKDEKLKDAKLSVVEKYGVSFSNGVLRFESKGAYFSDIVHIKKESDYAIKQKPQEVHIGSVTVGGVTSGGAYTTGGYSYGTGASSSGKYSLRYMLDDNTDNNLIKTIALTPEQYKKASASKIAQYLDGKNAILVDDPNVEYSQAELVELRRFAYGQGGTSHVVHKSYPTYEKCTAIMKWLTEVS